MGSAMSSVDSFSLTPEGAGSHPQMTQITTDVFMGFTPLLDQKSAARTPKQLRFCIAKGALSLPEGAEIVSRAAARLCERPRSLPTRATAPAGPENQGAPTARRSCAPPGAGRCFWRDRWRRSRGSLADRLAIGGPAGPQGPAGPVFQRKGAGYLTAFWG